MRRNENAADNLKTVENDNDVFASLLRERILFLTDEITSERASILCGQMMLLSLQDPDKDLYLFINSEGGNVTDTMAIYDMMQAVNSDVTTICIGEAASGAAVLLSGGAKGKRYALPHARVMLHQPQGGIEGSSRDVEIEAKELVRLRGMLSEILEHNTDRTPAQLHAILDRDTYMDARMAKEYGIIDAIIDKIPSFE